MAISIKSDEEIELMRDSGRLASEVLDFITPYVSPGTTTEELDRLCHNYMVDVQKVIPAPLNYAPPGHKPFPKSICTSVNHQICHGIPGPKKLKDGDILNIDVTVIKNGYHGDTSRMFFIGKLDSLCVCGAIWPYCQRCIGLFHLPDFYGFTRHHHVARAFMSLGMAGHFLCDNRGVG